MKRNQRSDSYKKNKNREWQKKICPNCLMNFIREPDEKLCKECIDDICDDILAKMEKEQEGEQV